MNRIIQFKRIALLLTVLWTTAFGMASLTAEPLPVWKKLNAIILTGYDPAHSWKRNSAEIKAILEATHKFSVDVMEDYKILSSAADLAKYDVLILNGAFYDKPGKGKEPQPVFVIEDQAKKNLLDFVNNGKGFYAQHLASVSWDSWDDFAKMEGQRWVRGKSGHASREPFEVKITNPEHPITRGLNNFTTDDECYARFGIFSEVDILATGFSKMSNVDEPMLMAHSYGKGHVVISTLGHDVKAMLTPETRIIIARGVEWAATGGVTPEQK